MITGKQIPATKFINDPEREEKENQAKAAYHQSVEESRRLYKERKNNGQPE